MTRILMCVKPTVLIITLSILSFFTRCKIENSVDEAVVNIRVTPQFNYRYDIMKIGVIQHVDRDYTYDIIPDELQNGLLFQGIHRPPKGTVVTIELLKPSTIYFFFHYKVDGGYSEIFEQLENWEICDSAPQYDITNDDHGLNMIMYKLEGKKGIYKIPPTEKDRACFSVVIQEN